MKLPPSLNPDRFGERFIYHLENAGGDLHSYTRGHKLQLGQHVKTLRTIYLDTNFWLYLRDTFLGRSRGRAYDELYELLHNLVSAGTVVCPITAYTWFEINRQTDVRTRKATAELVDHFSQGIGINSLDQRMGIEITHFLRSSLTPGADLYAPKELIWTKAAYLLGDLDPWTATFAPNEMLAFQKAWFDMFWNLPLTDIIERQGQSPSDKHIWERVAEEQTQGKQNNPATDRTFKSVLMDEVAGILEASQHIVDSVTEDLIPVLAGMSGINPTEHDAQTLKSMNFVSTAIYQIFLRNKIKTELPVIRIMASLHAAVRLDAPRKFRANDQYDFGHAAAALPYCNAFFTEGPFRHLIVTPPVALDRVYGTTVLSDPNDALDYLKK